MKLFTYSLILILALFSLYMAYLVGNQEVSYIVTPQDNSSREINQNRLFEVVNKFRVDNGLPEYREDPSACKIADIRVQDIQLEFSHRMFVSRVNTGKIVGENLSRGFYNDQDVLSAWIYSKKHRDNLLADFRGSCIRCENRYCVQIFTESIYE